MVSWPTKDPNEYLDYQVDWSDRLVTGETISTSNFVLESGDVVLSNPGVSASVTTIWIAGGTAGQKSVITNRITTSAGRIYDQEIAIRVRGIN